MCQGGKYYENVMSTGQITKKTTNYAGKPVRFHDLVAKFGEIYLGGDLHATPTLVRKLFHARMPLVAASEKGLQLLAQVDKHSMNVAKRHYEVASPKNDAELGKLLYTLIFGNPPEFPSMKDMNTHVLTIKDVDVPEEVELRTIFDEDDVATEEVFAILDDVDDDDEPVFNFGDLFIKSEFMPLHDIKYEDEKKEVDITKSEVKSEPSSSLQVIILR
jgi:hypothetical protein